MFNMLFLYPLFMHSFIIFEHRIHIILATLGLNHFIGTSFTYR